MRLLVQRVKKAEVQVDGNKVGSIEGGLFVLVGIKKDDTEQDAERLAIKLSKLRGRRERQNEPVFNGYQ